MTSDILTGIGVVGAIVVALGYFLSNYNIGWLWLSSLGFAINWYGDSLDGTLARVRGTQRPKYGFFLDHTIDALTISLMCVGAGLGPMLKFEIALMVLAAYLVLSVYTYICTIVKGEFRLTYGKLGPTEFRLIVIILNTLWIYTPWRFTTIAVGSLSLGLFDIGGLAIALILIGLCCGQWLKDRKQLSAADPLPKPLQEQPKEQQQIRKRA